MNFIHLENSMGTIMKSFASFKYWYFILIVAVTLAFLPILIRPGEPLQLDLPVWTSMTHLLRTEIVPEQKWFWGVLIEREEAGMVHGESYSLALIIPWMISFVVKEELAVKIICWVTGLILSLSLYFLIVRFTLPFFAAVASFLLFLSGYEHITDGMWYNLFSIALALLFWIVLERYLRLGSNFLWGSAILILALIVFCHPMGILGAMIIWLILLIYLVVNKTKPLAQFIVLKFSLVPALAFMLAAPQALSILHTSMHTDSGTIVQNFRWKQLIGLVLNLNLFNKWLQLLIVLVAFLGMIHLWQLNKQFFLISFGLFSIAVALTCRLFLYLPIEIRFLSQLMNYNQKFQYWTQAIYLLWFAIGLAALFKCGMSVAHSRSINIFFAANILLFFLIGVFLTYSTINLVKIMNSGRQLTLKTYSQKWEIYELFNWIKSHIDPAKTRVFIEDTKGTYKWKNDYPETSSKNCRTHMLALSDIYTRVLHVGGWFYTDDEFSRLYRGDGGALFGMRRKEDYSEKKLLENMRLLNCQYIVANSDEAKNFLDNISLLECVSSIGRFRIYEYKEFKPAWVFFENRIQEGVGIEKKSPTEILINNIHEREGSLIVSIAYNKRWKAYESGKKIPLSSRAGLIYIPLGNQIAKKIQLKYEIPKAISLAIVALGLLIFFSLSILISSNCTKIKRKI